MTQPCDVSVVISTRNRADMLVGCLRSLIESRATAAVEVIVVDNASTDGTRRVIESFQGHPEVPVHYIWEPRRGVSHGRNAGIARATGRIIAFTDDDIVVSSGWVDDIHRVFEQHPDIDCVGGAVLPLWSESPPHWLDSRHWSPLSVTDHGSRHSKSVRRIRYACLPRVLHSDGACWIDSAASPRSFLVRRTTNCSCGFGLAVAVPSTVPR